MKYKGMTVNERLYLSGFMDEYDKAVKEKNVEKIREILQKVELNEISIEPILEQLGLDSNQNLTK
ncbi:MAG: hypothetical protein RBR87_16600 [Bacteroidales bacterium]|jgi:hypothetical protein|nr:hypothetical protein [Bacteroidales bacterium]